MTGLIFEVIQQHSGGFVASCNSTGITTRGSNLAELHANINGALDHYFSGEQERPHPSQIRLLVSEE